MNKDNKAIFEAYNSSRVPRDQWKRGYWTDYLGLDQPLSNEESRNPTPIKLPTGNITYIHDDQWHREDGPALIRKGGDNAFCLNDRIYRDIKVWASDVLKSQRKPHDAQSIDEFLRPIIAQQTQDLI